MKDKPIHILRYGTVAEKVHLEKALGAYDYLSINGNTAAYVSNAIAKFIVEKFFSNSEKGYFIDPITYAFQNSGKVNTIELLYNHNKSGERVLKKSIEKLLDIYGEPTEKINSSIGLLPDDFSKAEVRDAFCEKVLDFQYTLIEKHVEENDLGKYIEYISKEKLPQLHPKFLIAPYFYLDADDYKVEQWLDLNIQFLKKSKELSSKKFNSCKVFAQITINKNVLTNETLNSKIIELYNSLEVEGLTIWVDDLNEHEASETELTAYISFLSKLSCKIKYNMYGGYLSILLTHKNIKLFNGVSHGLEYGESRKVYPVGGGLPVSKYYFAPIHKRMDFTDAFYLLENTSIIDSTLVNWGSTALYYNQVCKCNQCVSILKKEMINFIEFESREFYEIKRKNQTLRRKKASTDTKQNCLYHYLLSKMKEFKNVGDKKLTDLLGELIEQYNKFRGSEYLLKDKNLEYLCIWEKVLKIYE